ncbi:hypothetical protein HMJ29_08515 [Hymenobacter taeanensis]|uniref:STAS/SEC14 domain-containing protein n=1 Tax=Hymenobacter taeanensis TaxID=2735321 RepID=A0A6M6BI45_9BACT|nr:MULTISPECIES: hypothetical protein [Hymenobacter]QJX46973.1 hypothetical protein HMJ29_08515 [Hymenobacter taeanensis]UOQ80851.1 hypothetical protein MUN83_18880 [Hymenobacter sp. 5414T-23]
MASPEITDFLSLTHRPDLGVLVARWQRQPLPDELHQGYWQILEVALAQQCRFWLIDARRRDNANQQNTPWMMETFFPAVGAQLGHSVYVAFLFAPAHLTEIEADTSVPPLTYFDGRPYHVQRFTDEHHAMEWLAACQQAKQVG